MAVEALLSLVLLMQAAPPTPAPVSALALDGEAAESFLRTAEVVEREDIPMGVTRPQRLTLSDGELTLYGTWKTINEHVALKKFSKSRSERDFRDSYKNEIAAYELDKLLGLGLVPPTVERRLKGDLGSLQLWLEGVISEWERKERGLSPPNLTRWNEDMLNVRLFHQLIYETDYNNIQNLLLDQDFRIFVIDSSRSFRLHRKLRKEEALFRFSRSLLDRLRALDFDTLKERTGRWLTGEQIKALLARRDLIVAHAEELVAEKGEEAVLYP